MAGLPGRPLCQALPGACAAQVCPVFPGEGPDPCPLTSPSCRPHHLRQKPRFCRLRLCGQNVDPQNGGQGRAGSSVLGRNEFIRDCARSEP